MLVWPLWSLGSDCEESARCDAASSRARGGKGTYEWRKSNDSVWSVLDIPESITAAVAVLVIAGAAAAYGDGAAGHPSISREEIEKLKAAQFNNRAQGGIFDDGYDVVCPQFTSLVHSVDQKLQFITPTYSLDGLGAYSRDGYQSNSKEIIFSNRDCRYIITVKKKSHISRRD